MKSLGIVRAVDSLGRIVIPIELRRTLDINEKDGLEIFIESDRIILRKYQPNCMFCSRMDDLKPFAGKQICRECAVIIGGLPMLDIAAKSVVGGTK